MLNYRSIPVKVTLRSCSVVLLALGLTGCALMHEDPEPIPQIQPEEISLANDIHLARDGWPSARWWESYEDPQLNALIDQALNGSPTMEVARNQVEQARAQVELVQSLSSFQLMGTASIDQMRVGGGGLLPPELSNISFLDLPGPWFTAGMIGVKGGYQFDIWGKQKSRINAAIGMQNAQLAEQAAVELEISTTVAQVYYDIQAAMHAVDLLEQSHEIVTETVAAHVAREARGLESRRLTEQARAQQLSIEKQISSTNSMVRQLREGLRALVGAGAGDLPAITQAPLPASQAALPATLSYELLSRRPDLQAMRWYVQATVSRVDVAKAAFYPSFDIKAFYGLSSLKIGNLFRSDNQQFNLIPGLTLPIFDGGRLNAQLKGASAAGNTAIAQYNQSVLNAVRDVAIAGASLQGLDEQERLQNETLKAVTFLKDSAEAYYNQGLADRITAMKARLPVNAEKITLLGIHKNQISQSIALIKALGGGYQAAP